ncbi:undecaprenyl/decaprenyl-phosphate alpha-N-acetylglucosaminyl 1-phosphate transferase [Mucilaginibacter rubeus]|uniref:Undecaprenyl/decaprenyl-phosphate alpha-N-acetylglucosaminyl 1-phosphate transferase n=1 Tax=Mucilaginibacter rubeus TaxID=2027860 RepID=A0AAE6JIW9_9SPHI|nr:MULTISPECIES: MraY family glycosyltransferase [Mucilaginibacter]QEM05775.1 undecaprenyl/decaprenyl-phosphate alpha-N-acetylglucosaminyl 1-phosphate transferase [Mucilaginibacter rubeus]QEM18359.1 undecaprenyl/decaprenyl-phosphate alpha-N-acetylglucosaminyl 1-phosphate transferase [Mucilaginibacter gossypii]QTE45105.1 undecaprenyl/decaprenyl-phosphate alpha-N-acetylglucosaminyl 1-phosphate transferase [Mucilaginibacter rubeus]QTE51702.1 undecaprenyl/decaprenyl-phosphate alpha-N-acetylglucosam
MLEFLRSYHFVYNVLIVVFSTLITLLCIPSILHVARARHLYDDVGHFRKQHDHGIPRLGGVAIFVSFTITVLLFIDKSLPVSYLLTACIILFAMGLKDDLSGVNSSTKFMIQFVVAAILVIPGDIRISSMYGVFNITALPYIPSVMLSILVIMLIINSFNLIDGIDGLAATTGIIANSTFATLFIYMNEYELAAISLAIVGAVAGFLRFNITPAKIFMGDTGALLIGLVSAVMAIRFIELSKVSTVKLPFIYTAPALIIAVLIGPVFDTLRVFTIRILNKKSPFDADRNHIHHRMLKMGLTHLQTTFVLGCLNLVSIVMVLVFNNLNNSWLIAFIFLLSISFNGMITYFIRSKKGEALVVRNFSD